MDDATTASGSGKKKKNGSDTANAAADAGENEDHLRLYGKEASEVQYGERCPICNSRIDEFGYCACGAAGD